MQQYNLLIYKKFSFDYLLASRPFSTTFIHYYKIIIQENGKLVTYTPCLKCHVHNKLLTGLRRTYVGIDSLACIINMLITPVGRFDEFGLSGQRN